MKKQEKNLVVSGVEAFAGLLNAESNGKAATAAWIDWCIAEGFAVSAVTERLKSALIELDAWPMKDGKDGAKEPQGEKSARTTPAGKFYNSVSVQVSRLEVDDAGHAVKDEDGTLKKKSKAPKEPATAAPKDAADRAKAGDERRAAEIRLEISELMIAARVRISSLRRDAEKKRAAGNVEDAVALDGMLKQIAALLGIEESEIAIG
jgi:hypothetical protein